MSKERVKRGIASLRSRVIASRREARSRRSASFGLLLSLSLSAAVVADASAQEKFLGVTVQPMSGTYEVVTDANVRAKPAKSGRRLGGLRKGAKVEVVGRARGAWLAVRSGDRDLGFVYEPLLKTISLPPLERNDTGEIVDDEGNPVAPATGLFMAAVDVNLRNKPSTSAPKRGKLDRGAKVEAFGSAKDGTWFVVRKEDEELGFVFAEMLVPLIDGELDSLVMGKTGSEVEIACEYGIRYIGKGEVEGELFQTADYEIDWRCQRSGKAVIVSGYMFITEAPYQVSEAQTYQISVDLLKISRGYDKVFSTIFLYQRPKAQVVYDSVSFKEFGKAPGTTELPAQTVEDALRAAAAMAPEAWNEDVWKVLTGEAPPPDLPPIPGDEGAPETEGDPPPESAG